MFNHPDADAALAFNRTQLMAALHKLGATTVLIEYDGSGDSGDVQTLTVSPDDLTPLLLTEQIMQRHVRWGFSSGEPQCIVTESQQSLHEALEDFVCACLEKRHPGWENNDGGSGEFTVNMADDTCLLSHITYYTESFSNETSF
jgi:hypothetical protein